MVSSYFNIDRVNNSIRFLGNFQGVHVRRTLATIHGAVNNLGYQELVLDFSQCNSAFSAAILPLVCQVDRLRANRIDVSLVLPTDAKLGRMFANANWAHMLEPRTHHASDFVNYRQFPATRYRDAKEQNDVVNRIMDRVLSSVSEFDRGDFAALEWALSEITDNVLNHSNAADGGIVQLSIFEDSRRAVEFTVSDAGVGVHQTIRDAFSKVRTDGDALMEAVKEGVTRNRESFQGNGLYGSLAISQQGTGRFALSAGHSTLLASSDGVRCLQDPIPFLGTTVDMVVNFREPGQLAQALSFAGKPYRPVDLIEMRYESDALDQVVINLAEHADGLRSRRAATPLRTKLSNLVHACAGQRIVIDFRGVSVVSSSFADEVFGKLFKELGPMTFMRVISFVNISGTVQSLIDRAITQRMSDSVLPDDE